MQAEGNLKCKYDCVRNQQEKQTRKGILSSGVSWQEGNLYLEKHDFIVLIVALFLILCCCTNENRHPQEGLICWC